VTGAVRWFIPAPANGVNDAAPLTITGFPEACRHDPIRKKAAWGAVSTRTDASTATSKYAAPVSSNVRVSWISGCYLIHSFSRR